MIYALETLPKKYQTVFVRAGFDVPMSDGEVTDTTRINAVLPTIQWLINHNHAVVIGAHQGRPKGEVNLEYSQQPLVKHLQALLHCPVQFCPEATGPMADSAKSNLQSGEVLLLENLRFDPREKSKQPEERLEMATELANGIDAYINEAFPNCHRDHASMVSLAQLKPAFAGLQLAQEIKHLQLRNDTTQMCLIIGGAKMETKVPVVEKFIGSAKHILVGGMIATTFQVAKGNTVGESAYEIDHVPTAQKLLALAKKHNTSIEIPTDVIVADSIDSTSTSIRTVPFSGKDQSFDIGPDTEAAFTAIIKTADYIIWNGPVGVSTKAQFSSGTTAVANVIIHATTNGATSIVGGGDSLKFFSQAGISEESFTFVSTGGGAMLEYIAGKNLPAIVALERE